MDIDEEIGTQALELLSQPSYVSGFDQSQTNKEDDDDDWLTPLTTIRKLGSQEKQVPQPTEWKRWKIPQLTDSPMESDGSPKSSLYYFSEESWDRFTEWAQNPVPLRLGPICFNLVVAQRVVLKNKWLGNEVMLY